MKRFPVTTLDEFNILQRFHRDTKHIAAVRKSRNVALRVGPTSALLVMREAVR